MCVRCAPMLLAKTMSPEAVLNLKKTDKELADYRCGLDKQMPTVPEDGDEAPVFDDEGPATVAAD